MSIDGSSQFALLWRYYTKMRKEMIAKELVIVSITIINRPWQVDQVPSHQGGIARLPVKPPSLPPSLDVSTTVLVPLRRRSNLFQILKCDRLDMRLLGICDTFVLERYKLHRVLGKSMSLFVFMNNMLC